MLQLFQNVKSGELKLVEVPAPVVRANNLLIRTSRSVVSAGTEKTLVDFGGRSLIGKARSRPDLVKKVLDKARKDGWVNAFQTAMSRLESPMALGYSAAGVVLEVGSSVPGFSPGDRVALAGAGYANHAEFLSVPHTLAAKIPADVGDEEAAYTTVASIAMQGVRQAAPSLGDTVVVIGLGLLGILTVQLLKANGCRVFGVDLNPEKIELGKKFGLDDGHPLPPDEAGSAIEQFTNGRGADGVIITAATSSSEPINLAAEVLRRKGQVTVVGAVGMSLERDPFYKKELELRLSMSYGPGRYDPSYEEGGVDYPYEYVRWTEQRNMESVLQLMSEGKLKTRALTTHRYAIDQALEAFQLLKTGHEPYLGIVLEYTENTPLSRQVKVVDSQVQKKGLGIGFIGAGNYASMHLIPHLKKRNDVTLRGVSNSSGPSARSRAEQFGFEYCSTGVEEIVSDDKIDTIFIATRHDTHTQYTLAGLRAGKAVFVEKPLVRNLEEWQELDTFLRENESPPLMVGYNRRFAPLTEKMKSFFQGTSPVQILYRVNAGPITKESWTHSSEQGGGMLISEMCHFVDLMIHLVGSVPTAVNAQSAGLSNSAQENRDNVCINLRFSDGSLGTLVYSTMGSAGCPKEQIQVFGGGKTAILSDFQKLETWDSENRAQGHQSRVRDKGQKVQIAETVEAFRKGTSPIPLEQLMEGALAVLAAQESLGSHQPCSLDSLRKTEAPKEALTL